MRKWDELPDFMRIDEVRPYHDILWKKRYSLIGKRLFDIVVSIIMIIILLPVLVIVGLAVMIDSPGGAIYRQERVTRYGRRFKVLKFRTMVANADKIGSHVTVEGDKRITRIGRKIRDVRLDELPQLFNILRGDMSFVGTRPEVPKYVDRYQAEMFATLLMPAGVTSSASIMFKDEAQLLEGSDNPDEAYVKRVLPEKMKYNLHALRNFSWLKDLSIIFKTMIVVLK